MDFLGTPIGYLMDWIYSLVSNYGLTIIVLTILFKLVLLPLTIKQQKSTQAMQAIQPRMAEIQKKYANEKITDIDGVTKRADLRIPTLEEYVRTCKRYDKVCVLEFKTVYPVEHIAEMVEIIKKEEYLDKVIFISFAYENLTRLHEVVPGHPCQFLAWQWTDDLFDNLQRDGIDLDAYYGLLTEERVAEAHRRGLVVNAWTVDDPKVAEQLAEWGVDQITSNILE